MKINDLIKEKNILLKKEFKTKQEVFDKLIDLLLENKIINEKKLFSKAIYERENLTPTAIENGVVIPHAKSKTVNKTGLVICTLKRPIDCNAFDGKLSDLFIMIATPENAGDEHLIILKDLMTILKNDLLRNDLKQAHDKTSFLNLFNQEK